MHIINIHDAKSNLSNLINKAYKGEEVIICKAGEPMAKLIKYEAKKVRKIGLCKGKIKVPEDFDDTSQDIIDMFYGKEEK